MEPATERKTVRVTIFNQTYSLAATGDAEEVQALAHSVDELMTGIAQRAGNMDANRIAVKETSRVWIVGQDDGDPSPAVEVRY